VTAAQESNFTRSAQGAVTPAAYAPPSYVQYVLQHHQLRQQQQCRGSEQTWPARWSIGASDSGARTYGCCYIQYSTVQCRPCMARPPDELKKPFNTLLPEQASGSTSTCVDDDGAFVHFSPENDAWTTCNDDQRPSLICQSHAPMMLVPN
jgi:hypothetical protein